MAFHYDCMQLLLRAGKIRRCNKESVEKEGNNQYSGSVLVNKGQFGKTVVQRLQPAPPLKQRVHWRCLLLCNWFCFPFFHLNAPRRPPSISLFLQLFLFQPPALFLPVRELLPACASGRAPHEVNQGCKRQAGKRHQESRSEE